MVLADKPLLDITSARNGRRAAILSLALSANGLSHKFYVAPWRAFTTSPLQKLALASPSCSRTYRRSETSLLITDDINTVRARELRHKKTIYISYTTGQPLDYKFGNHVFLPILFHPKLLNEQSYLDADNFSVNLERSVTLLFAGNSAERLYGGTLSNGLMNRSKLYVSIRNHVSPAWILPSSYSEFRAAIQSGETLRKPVWIDTYRARIPRSEWLKCLSETRYFLAAPGVKYPYCHNLTEAMACGAVPVLEHKNLYSPPLVNGKNCISFCNEVELEETVRQLFVNPYAAWLEQSSSAVSYHKKHLSKDRLGELVSDFQAQETTKVLEIKMAGKASE